MKKIYLKLIIFVSPFIINVLLIIIVDPYNFIGLSKVISDKVKVKCIERNNETKPRGNVCWKTLEYERNPSKNVLIGDSRLTQIDNTLDGQVFGQDVYNYSISGNDFPTARDVFWEIVKNKKVEKIFFQLGFVSFDQNVDYNLMSFIKKYKRDPLKYFYDKSIIKDTWVILYYLITKDENYVDINYHERNIDMMHRSEVLLKRQFEHYNYSKEYERALIKISKYCKENDIELIFILLPKYQQFNIFLHDYNLTEDYNNFVKLLSESGKLINLDNMDEFSSNRENFRDYFHYRKEMLDSITYLIWHEAKNINKLSPESTPDRIK